MKTLLLLRGLPGSGKSSLSLLLQGLVGESNCKSFEADSYFLKGEEYVFDKQGLGPAHQQCQKSVMDAMLAGIPLVIVANTLTTDAEVGKYEGIMFDVNMALRDNGLEPYTMVSVIVENRHGSKTLHSVPLDVLTRMRNRFDVKL